LVVGSISGSQFVNHAYLVLLPPILPILSRDLGVSIGLLGLALGVQALVNTAFQLPWISRGPLYRTITLGISPLLGAIGALVTAIAPDFWMLVFGQVILGIRVAGHHPAHYPLLSDATPEDARGRASAVYNFGGRTLVIERVPNSTDCCLRLRRRPVSIVAGRSVWQELVEPRDVRGDIGRVTLNPKQSQLSCRSLAYPNICQLMILTTLTMRKAVRPPRAKLLPIVSRQTRYSSGS